MPYEVKWLVKDRVILDRVFGNATLTDVKATSSEISVLLRQVSKPQSVYLLVDLSELLGVSFGRDFLGIHRSMSHMSIPSLAYSIMITENTTLRTLASSATRIARTKHHSVANRQQAVEYLLSLAPDLESHIPADFFQQKA